MKDEKARPQQEERAIRLWRHPDWTSWYAGVDCTRQQTIAAVTVIPPFVHQFGGTAPPPPPTALDEAIAELVAARATVQDLDGRRAQVVATLRSLRS